MRITGLTPEPVCCSENKCENKPIIAYWRKGKKVFEFACGIHCNFVGDSIVTDKIDDYVKKSDRKMYHKIYGEYLK